MEKVYVKADLLSSPNRIDECKIALERTGNFKTEVMCSSFYISTDKPDIDLILRSLKYDYEEMVHNTSDFDEIELITKIYNSFIKVIREHQ